MGKRKKPTLKNKVSIIVSALALVCLVVLSVLITYFPNLGLPKWNEISRFFNLNETVNAEVFPFSVHYLDVGQADCTLIRCGEDTMMIDAGDVDAYRTIDAYLKAQGISSIQYLVLTHAHADHIGSADDVLKNYPVEQVIMPKYSAENTPTSQVYEDLLYALQDSDAKVIAAASGRRYSLSAFSFTILAPNADYSDLNNSSVVLRATYGETAFLFQGDAEKKSEKDILDTDFLMDANVIKLGHHGSKTSSTAEYLERVNPELAIISCGLDNAYNFPSESVLQYLEENAIDYRRTDRNGTIVVTSDGKEISCETER